ncbi:MAG: hypothetical protein JEZ05_10740 [Tenericutes bacterium]|nr:hypothetical protein [Mycoplasmatota bacterium]
MIYYGIVDKIKDEHESGIYGRRALSEKEAKKEENNYSEYLSAALSIVSFIPIIGIYARVGTGAAAVGINMYNKFKANATPISLQYKLDSAQSNDYKYINIPCAPLDKCYKVNDELFYGLFDNFNNKEKGFKTIMESHGGSTLIMFERETLPKTFKHYGGENGRFSTGLYCPHPKDSNILIPLDNYSEIIKSLKLEEVIRAFQSLGAKKIIIEDRTTINADIKGKYKGVDSSTTINLNQELLREKQFGRGNMNEEKALSDNLFIHDMPNVTTVLQGRTSMNQIVEKFSETVDLSAGADISVLGLFEGNMKGNYKRKWYFDVEFYDKN